MADHKLNFRQPSRSLSMIRAAFEVRRPSVLQLCLYPGDPTNSARRKPWEHAISSAALSPIMIDAAFVLPLTIFGMTLASATRSPATPLTRSSWSTTLPILHVEQRW